MSASADEVIDEVRTKIKEGMLDDAREKLENTVLEDGQLLLDEDSELLLCYCIVRDKERDPVEPVEDVLNNLVNHGNKDDGDYLHAVAKLALKWNEFDISIKASENATGAGSDNTTGPLNVADDKYWKCCLYKAYSHEGNEDFDRAIQFMEEKLKMFKEQDDLPDFDKDYVAEFNHALGHFYIGRAMFNSKPSIQDIHDGREKMKRARDADEIYTTCYGAIHKETRDFNRSLQILNKALDRWTQRGHMSNGESKHIVNEILYYKADCLMWLNKDEEARDLLHDFKQNLETNDGDSEEAQLQAELLKMASKLRNEPIPTKQGDMKNYRANLTNFQDDLDAMGPTIYTPPSVKKYYKRVKTEIKFFLRLSTLISQKRAVTPEEISELREVVSQLREYTEMGEPNVYALSDLPQNRLKRDLFSAYTDGECPIMIKPTKKNSLRPIQQRDENRVVVCIWEGEVPPSHIAFIAANPQHTYIRLEGNNHTDAPEVMEQEFLYSGQERSALQLACLLSEYDDIRREQTEPMFLLGLTPTWEAPSLFAQAGKIEWSKLEGQKDE